MAAALGLWEIRKLGAGVAKDAIVDELQLAGFKIEIGGERFVVEQIGQRDHRGGALSIERLVLQRIAAADLVGTEARLQFLARGKHRRGKDRRLAGMEFALAVEPERAVEPRQALRMARQKRIVERVKARDPAVAAALGRLQAK